MSVDPVVSPTMPLETMDPNPDWDADAHATAVDTIAALADRITVRIWCADWCQDCQATLPDVAAALEAAGVPDASIHQYVVDRDKDGPLTDPYGVEYIPTIVIEIDGREVARFVESADRPAADHLAAELATLERTA